MAALLRNVYRIDEALGLNLSQLVVCFATEVHWLLGVGNACTAVCEVPAEDRKPAALEAMQRAPGINHELPRDVVRRAAVRVIRLRAHGGPIR